MTKKIFSILTAAAVVSSAVPCAFAANYTYDELILSVKNRIEIPEEFTEFENSGQYESDGITQYSFTWYTDEEEREYINVSCDSDGFISSYSDNNDEYSRYDSLEMDEEKAKSVAYDFVVQANPELSGIVSLERQTGTTYGGISFNIIAKFYGIDYYKPVGSVIVSKNYSVRSMNIDMPEPETPDADVQYINDEEAYSAYMDKIGIETTYLTYYDDDDKLQTFPVYCSKYGKAIDAATGDVTEIKNDILFSGGCSDSSSESSVVANANNGAYKELNDSELEQMALLNGLISKDEAVSAIKDRVMPSFEAESSSLFSVTGGRYFYNLHGEGATFSVDAQNGDIVSVYTNSSQSGDITTLGKYDFSDPVSAKMLIEALAPANGSLYTYDDARSSEEVKVDDSISLNRSIFSFEVNGIPVEGANASVYQYKDGSDVDYSINISPLDDYKNAEYTDPSEFIDIDKLFGDTSFIMLRYINTENGVVPGYITETFMKNAVTGMEVDYMNEEVQSDDISYSDIEGHWVSDVAKKLAAVGIGFRGGKLDPDKTVTYNDAYEILESAYSMPKENTDDIELTRIEAAELIIKCTDLEELAEMDIYSQPYSDIYDNFGTTAILKGYGIIAGDTDQFRPNDPLTRAELLQLVYNSLIKIR